MITPRSSTETLIAALRVLASDLESLAGEVVGACLREAADRMEEMQRQLERVGWQPIETAPRGKEILVYCEGCEGIGIAWLNKYGDIVIPEPQAIGHESLTHWMPLPPPPKT